MQKFEGDKRSQPERRSESSRTNIDECYSSLLEPIVSALAEKFRALEGISEVNFLTLGLIRAIGTLEDIELDYECLPIPLIVATLEAKATFLLDRESRTWSTQDLFSRDILGDREIRVFHSDADLEDAIQSALDDNSVAIWADDLDTAISYRVLIPRLAHFAIVGGSGLDSSDALMPVPIAGFVKVDIDQRAWTFVERNEHLRAQLRACGLIQQPNAEMRIWDFLGNCDHQISPETENRLDRHGNRTLGEMAAMSPAELQEKLGTAASAEFLEYLQRNGFSFD